MGINFSVKIRNRRSENAKITELYVGDDGGTPKRLIEVTTKRRKNTSTFEHTITKIKPSKDIDIRRGDSIVQINSELVSSFDGTKLSEQIGENEFSMVIRRTTGLLFSRGHKCIEFNYKDETGFSSRVVQCTKIKCGKRKVQISQSKNQDDNKNESGDKELFMIYKDGKVTMSDEKKDNWCIAYTCYYDCPCTTFGTQFARIEHQGKEGFITIGKEDEVEIISKAPEDELVFKIDYLDHGQTGAARIHSKQCKSKDYLYLHWDDEEKRLSFKTKSSDEDTSYVFNIHNM